MSSTENKSVEENTGTPTADDCQTEASGQEGIYLNPLTGETAYAKSGITTISKIIEDNDKMKKLRINTLIVFICIILSIAFTAASLVYLVLSVSVNPLNEDEQPVIGTALSYNDIDPFGDTLTAKSDNFTQYPTGLLEKFKPLYAQNQDFAGWLTVPGTNIDMPVWQGNDNDKYFRHDNYGAYFHPGVAFIDGDCLENCWSRNTVIYAHNFGNGMLFDRLHNYLDLDFYKKHPVIYYSTPYADYAWKVVACFVTNGSYVDDNDYLFYYVAPEMADACLMEFSDEIRQRSFVLTNVDIQPSDRLLTLSTCTYYFDVNGGVQNARLGLVARLIRDGESQDVDTSQAVLNQNIRMPQLYYDVFGGQNPYVNASKWKAY